jgi:hypothetical protein
VIILLKLSSRYVNIPYKGRIDSQNLSSILNNMVSDINSILNSILKIQDFISNSIISGFTISYDSSNLIVSSDSGYITKNGVQEHYTPSALSLQSALTAGDVVYLDTVANTLTLTSNSNTVALAEYTGNGFDYSVRPILSL